MAIDSTAELLFKISADPEEAKHNIAAFRQLLSKDLASMRGDFESWSEHVLGNMNSFKGAALGATAAIAGGAVALGAALFAAGEKAAEYGEKIEEAMERTGLTAEQMSGLAFGAKVSGVELDALVSGLVKFAFSSSVVQPRPLSRVVTNAQPIAESRSVDASPA